MVLGVVALLLTLACAPSEQATSTATTTRGVETSISPTDYAQRCADIVRTTPPVTAGFDRVVDHLIREWRQLEPPPEAKDYHNAVLSMYIKWEEMGVINPASVEEQKVVAEGKKLAPDFYEHLLRAGCVGPGT